MAGVNRRVRDSTQPASETEAFGYAGKQGNNLAEALKKSEQWRRSPRNPPIKLNLQKRLPLFESTANS